MQQFIEISKEQTVMAFAATCIEATSRIYGIPYRELVQRLDRVGMIKDYIIRHYEVLHTESRENLTANIMSCLKSWEEKL